MASSLPKINHHILNTITPSGIDYTSTSNSLGDNYGELYFLSKYPAADDYGWLAPLCSLEGTTTCVEYLTIDPSVLIDSYNKQRKEFKTERDVAKDQSEKLILEQKIADIDELIRKLSVEKEPVGYINTMLHVQARDQKVFESRRKTIQRQVQVLGFNMRLLKYKQFNALEVIAPYGIPQALVANMGNRNMPISSFLGGFPMASTGIIDEGGYYLGKAKDKKLVLLNMWMREKDRTNSNWFIAGIPGQGKSTFDKLLLYLEYAFGSKIIILDPEMEYLSMARDPDINGDIINGTGGASGRINPLQVRLSPRITEADLDPEDDPNLYLFYDDENGLSDLALHIQNLRVFFKLYFGAENYTSGIRAALEKCLIITYEKKGITWETDISKLKNEDYPIISDLYETVKSERAKQESGYRKDSYDKLTDLLQSAAEGADQFIWNGPTTLCADSDFIVLNVFHLLEADENVKRAQFFNLTMWAWQQMSLDRTSKVIFAVDEGYQFVDPEYPDMMKFLRNISKRDRKYEGSLMFITHALVDVLDFVVKRFGQAIIDNSCYKFIMGTDGKNLQETADLLKLTEDEISILAAKKRGQGILFAGSTRMELNVDVYPPFLKRFGKAGGR